MLTKLLETILERRISCGYGNARPTPYLFCTVGKHWVPDMRKDMVLFCPQCGRKVIEIVEKGQDAPPRVQKVSVSDYAHQRTHR